MNSYNENELSDIENKEDKLSVIEIKIEPADIQGNTEAEECDIDHNTCPIYLQDAFFQAVPKVEKVCFEDATVTQLDLKSEMKVEAEECYKPTDQNASSVASTPGLYEVKSMQRSSDECLEDYIEKINKENNTSRNENIIMTVGNDQASGIVCQEKILGVDEFDGTSTSSMSEDLVLKQNCSVLHTQIDLKCSICSKSFTNECDSKHLNLYSTGKPFTCNSCNKLLHENRNVNQQTHNENPFCCDICNERFSQKKYLRTHKRTHRVEKQFKCDICLKCFKKKFNLTVHARIHKNLKPYTCNICTRSYSQKSSYTRHFRTHTNERRFACGVCNKRFYYKEYVQEHMIVHTNVREYACSICDKSFKFRCGLVRHLREHTKQRPFHCGNYVDYHTKEKTYICDVCMAPYTRRASFLQHKRKHINEVIIQQ